MKLSRLITYKHMVDGLTVNHVHDEIETLLKHVGNDLNIQNIDFDNLKNKIDNNSELVLSKLQEINADLVAFKQRLQEFVSGIESPYYAKSHAIYQEGLADSADYILDRSNFKKLLYQQETLDFFKSRVTMHSSWKWPALEIRPGYGEITDNLIACDPLYLVDTDVEMFKHVKQKWTPEYQQRLRYYTTNESDKRILHQLPVMQFGIVVAVDFFNFRPLELIKRYLEEIFNLLRPGGQVIFTYNNCDYPIGVDNFENSYYCYTPGREIKAMCEQIGFKVAASFDLENNVSWLEIQRPGTRTSLRGGQALGRIQNI
jgi:SAM-dependent methyltransferase